MAGGLRTRFSPQPLWHDSAGLPAHVSVTLQWPSPCLCYASVTPPWLWGLPLTQHPLPPPPFPPPSPPQTAPARSTSASRGSATPPPSDEERRRLPYFKTPVSSSTPFPGCSPGHATPPPAPKEGTKRRRGFAEKGDRGGSERQPRRRGPANEPGQRAAAPSSAKAIAARLYYGAPQQGDALALAALALAALARAAAAPSRATFFKERRSAPFPTQRPGFQHERKNSERTKENKKRKQKQREKKQKKIIKEKQRNRGNGPE